MHAATHSVWFDQSSRRNMKVLIFWLICQTGLSLGFGFRRYIPRVQNEEKFESFALQRWVHRVHHSLHNPIFEDFKKRKLMRFYQIRNDENEGIIPKWLWQSLSQSGSPLDTNIPSQLRKYRLVSSGPMGARPTGFDVANDISRRFDFLAKSVIEALKPKAMQTKAFTFYSK